jgi:polysaccharide deacetylase family protein (PEP-CTERM system associated)
MKNLLTFDIEGFRDALHESISISPHIKPDFSEKDVIETNTMEILSLLAECSTKGTFFILGWIAKDMPSLIRTIAQEGHEIACHGYLHNRLFNLSRAEAEDSLKTAKHCLEDVSGSAIYGFRAPDFSIIKSNLWVHDILQGLDFKYDSSLFPISFHDVYGMENIPRSPFKLPNGLIEIPLSTVRFIKNIPFGGGGYFRLYPFFFTKFFLTIINRQGTPGVFYLHPYEIGKVVPTLEGMGLLRRFRTYYGVAKAKEKLKKILLTFEFITVLQYIRAEWLSYDTKI